MTQGFGGAVPVVNGDLKPDSCDPFYYIHTQILCKGQEYEAPTWCPPNRRVNWDVCGCKMKVLKIGPIPMRNMFYGSASEWASLPCKDY